MHMQTSDLYRPVRPPRRRRVTVRDVDYHLTEWGSEAETPVLYLHGWGDTGSTFQFVVDAMAGDRHVIAPDFRGFGLTQKTGPAYWFPDYLADLDALIDRLGIETPGILVGHSMGGNVAGLYAGAMPERVRGFVNVEGFGVQDGDPAAAPSHYRRFLEKSRDVRPFSTYDNYDGLVARITARSPRLPPDRANFVAREWATRDADGRITLCMDPAHKLPNAVQYRRAEAEACWRAVRAPVLLVYGAETEFADWDEFEGWLAPEPADRPFPGAAVAKIADSGHMVHFEAPEALASLIETFVDDL